MSTPSAQLEAEILAVETRRQEALITGDLDALSELFDDSLVHIHAPGLVHTKQLLLEHVAVRRAYIEITRQDLHVRVFGDTAVITGGIVNRMHAPGGASARSTVWSRRCCIVARTAVGAS
ncbi:nuclear transport factor 2 family protein [Microbacterium suwonense]|uniref:DUF4440 domain-containing protein n=1 Tax=Microbacterium suwonense TaxID=683047 RepID=A0ABN6X5Y6_9MICO|nr:nuclear transport factor 2 family protein [Microbacterium suwonense]BDZ40086.1 hypothetical protein GCM10025863_27000 [Microbacterium suwonense]